MSSAQLKFGMLLVISSVILVFLAAKYTTLALQVALADEQVAVFESMKTSADNSEDPKTITSKLEYIMEYYPSGTKQTKGSKLDKIVECVRSNVMDSVIERLQKLTGKNFGNNPERWMNEYPPSKNEPTRQPIELNVPTYLEK